MIKKFGLILLAVVLVCLTAESVAKACDDNWGNDENNENDYE